MMGLGFEAWRLGLEASAVIGLRSARLAVGDARAVAEADLMIREKIASAMELGGQALGGRLGATPEAATSRVLTHYRRKVRANLRRLKKR
jgi:hypothetical protein